MVVSETSKAEAEKVLKKLAENSAPEKHFEIISEALEAAWLDGCEAQKTMTFLKELGLLKSTP